MLPAEERMRPNALPFPDYQRRYAATKIVRTIKTLKRLEFSGQVVWREGSSPERTALSADGREWIVFLERGNLCYGTGGSHSLRRWQRHLLSCCPHLLNKSIDRLHQANSLELNPSEHASENGGTLADCWEYQQLDRLLLQRQITPQNHVQIIEQILIELLFDITQAANVSHQLRRCPPRSPLGNTVEQSSPSIAIKPAKLAEETIFTTVEVQWQQWFEAKLSPYSPNLAPIVRQPDYLQAETSPQVFKTLMTLLDGQHTLRDLALKTQRPVQPFMEVLLPYVQSGWIELLQAPETPISSGSNRFVYAAEVTPPMVACIDDSLMICQSMEQVIRAAGYRFIAITEPARAIATLLTKKPDIIFLDLIMPDTNGYEICSQLRKVSRFKETPIIILTGNDGIVDQVRARLLGATDFLSKPMEPAVILSIIQRLIRQRV